MKFKHNLVLAALVSTAATAHAGGYQLELFAPPNNAPIVALSGNGALGVAGGTGSLFTAGGAMVPVIGGVNLSSISADGSTVLGSYDTGMKVDCMVSGVSQLCDTRQAASYDTVSKTWSALGSLGSRSASPATGTQSLEESSASALSRDGKVAVGSAFASNSRLHPVVFRDGKVIDLNAGANQTGKAWAVSGDGSVVTGYKSNSSIGSVWKWDGASAKYVEQAAPKIANPWTGALSNVMLDRISDNGTWVAGSSVAGMATNFGPAGRLPPYTVTFSPTTLWNTETQTGIAIPFDHVIDTTNSESNADIVKNMKATVAGVSNSGVVIGTFNLAFLGSNVGATAYDTWIYNAHGDGKAQTFDSYLGDLGLSLAPNQHVWNLFSMSADGTAIGGYIFDSSINQTSAFLLHTAAVPEPSTWALFGLALPLLAWRRSAARPRLVVGA